MRPYRATVPGNPVDRIGVPRLRSFDVIARGTLIVAVTALLAGVVAAAGGGTIGASATGSPERGRAVYFGPGGCSNCHSVSADPAEPSTGPQLTLETLRAHAADAGKPLADYVAESILVPGAYAAPGYVRGTMQPPRGLTNPQIEDLVSYLIGKAWSSSTASVLTLPAKPVSACDAKAACRATVARWKKAVRLPVAALPGAKIVAVSGCLSCHRYAGSGVKSGSAGDLTRIGLEKTTVAAHVRRLRCPGCVQPGSAMPSFAAYGDANLRRVAEFLRASRGVRR
jgi:mono/diheme cytochrome c family protein